MGTTQVPRPIRPIQGCLESTDFLFPFTEDKPPVTDRRHLTTNLAVVGELISNYCR